MATPTYNLIPTDVPSGRNRTGFYSVIVEEFLESGEVSVQVNIPDKKPASVAQGLRKAVVPYLEARMTQNGEDCYLVRRTEAEVLQEETRRENRKGSPKRGRPAKPKVESDADAAQAAASAALSE